MKEQNREIFYREILEQISYILGPSVPKCIECEGCRVEWNEALSLVMEALGEQNTN